MTTVLRFCPKCGGEIQPDAPEGACPRCLLKAGLRALANEDQDPPGLTPRQYGTRSERFAEILGELGDYELLEEIGRGGQGVVFRARQKSLNRLVALKVIGLGQWATKAHVKRFRLNVKMKDGKEKNVMPVSTAEYNPCGWRAWLDNTTITLGMQNVFDEDPPFVAGAFENGSDESLATIKGRFWYVQLKKRF